MPSCRQPIFNYFPPSFSEVDASLYSYADVLGLLRAVVLVRPVDCYDRTFPSSGSRSSSRSGLIRIPITGFFAFPHRPSTTTIGTMATTTVYTTTTGINRRCSQTGVVRKPASFANRRRSSKRRCSPTGAVPRILQTLYGCSTTPLIDNDNVYNK